MLETSKFTPRYSQYSIILIGIATILIFNFKLIWAVLFSRFYDIGYDSKMLIIPTNNNELNEHH